MTQLATRLGAVGVALFALVTFAVMARAGADVAALSLAPPAASVASATA
jgi:hypothetical protein